MFLYRAYDKEKHWNLESCWTGVLRCLLFPQRLLDVGKEEEQEEAAPPCRSLPQLCSIPRRLVISPGLGGAPVTPQLTEVRQRDGETKSKLTSYQLEGFSSCPSLSQSLRRILFGGTFHVFNYEWRKSVFQFRESDSEFSYALETDRVRHTCSFTTRHNTSQPAVRRPLTATDVTLLLTSQTHLSFSTELILRPVTVCRQVSP